MLTQVKYRLKTRVYVDLDNTPLGLALPFVRELGEGHRLANNRFILAILPDNALISLPQLSKISRPLPGETEMGGEPRGRAAGNPGSGAGPGRVTPSAGSSRAGGPPLASARLRAAAPRVARALPAG